MKVYVVTHKMFTPPQDDGYITIKVGGNYIGSNDFINDNTGDNISDLNDRFCEMTAVYWIWKNTNIQANDIVGLVHYRRYFKNGNENKPIQFEQIDKILGDYDIILPRKRNYCFVTVREHYRKAHHLKDFELLGEILKKEAPSYYPAYNMLSESRELCLYNTFITRGDIFISYCKWVFPILMQLDKIIDRKEYDAYQKRVIGFLAERLFNIWLIKNDSLKKTYLPMYNSEGESIFKKGSAFLYRQFIKRK